MTMKAACSSETSEGMRLRTEYGKLEYHYRYIHRRENLKFNIVYIEIHVKFSNTFKCFTVIYKTET
jgi:hypothetical protein